MAIMKRSLPVLTILVVLVNASLSKGEVVFEQSKALGHLNGRWWAMLTLSHKAAFTLGFMRGAVALAVNSPQGCQETAQIFYGAVPKDFLEAVDLFYSDSANKAIPIGHAFMIEGGRIKGILKDEEAKSQIQRLRMKYSK